MTNLLSTKLESLCNDALHKNVQNDINENSVKSIATLAAPSGCDAYYTIKNNCLIDEKMGKKTILLLDPCL